MGTDVALREEGVDRNMGENDTGPWAQVALREEGVDRNIAGEITSKVDVSRPP